jgi:hypothetical protein
MVVGWWALCAQAGKQQYKSKHHATERQYFNFQPPLVARVHSAPETKRYGGRWLPFLQLSFHGVGRHACLVDRAAFSCSFVPPNF